MRHADAVLRTMAPKRRIALLHQRLEALRPRPLAAVTRRLRHDQVHLRGLARSLEAVSPLATVARGYAILQRDDGHVIRSVQDVQAGQRLRRGWATARCRCG
jgi:exodeoxyribonuclease VII large subunit